MNFLISQVSLLQVFDREKTCINSFAFNSEQVVEAAASFVCLSEFHEEFEEQRAINNLFDRLRLVNYLLYKTFLDFNNPMQHDLGCVIIE